jgi:hypothetical protein
MAATGFLEEERVVRAGLHLLAGVGLHHLAAAGLHLPAGAGLHLPLVARQRPGDAA